MSDFSSLGLSEAVLRAVSAEGYSEPTPIQAQAIPNIVQGRDIVGIAETGTGKTAAFTLPLIQLIEGMPGRPEPKTCRVLIVAPTRELAAQIVSNVKNYSRFSDVSVAMVVGGAPAYRQIKALSGGVDVLVATPGRLLDHMAGGAVTLTAVRAVVLDEADQMLDLGFMPAIRKIMRATPNDRQTLLFSATMPKEIRALASDFLDEPEEIAVARVGKPAAQIKQRVIHMSHNDKRDALTELLADDAIYQAIVFTRTKRGADKVARHLVDEGIRTGALHSDKSQGLRDRTLARFRDGKLRVLVATDIAARGIDVETVSHVVNFDLPMAAEAYVHRIGRTARAGREGEAIAFCSPAELSQLRSIEKLIKVKIPAEGDVPAEAEKRGGGGNRGRNGKPLQARKPRSARPDRHNPRPEADMEARGEHRSEHRSDHRGGPHGEARGEHRGDHRSEHRGGPRNAAPEGAQPGDTRRKPKKARGPYPYAKDTDGRGNEGKGGHDRRRESGGKDEKFRADGNHHSRKPSKHRPDDDRKAKSDDSRTGRPERPNRDRKAGLDMKQRPSRKGSKGSEAGGPAKGRGPNRPPRGRSRGGASSRPSQEARA